MLVKINEQIDSIATLNILLQDEALDTFEIHREMKIGEITLMRLMLNSAFRNSFVAGDGHFRFRGEETYRSGEGVVCRIECLRSNAGLIFGKGFADISSFLSARSGYNKSCDFSVKMFSKQLYGRLVSKEARCSGGYGNCELSLFWRDELQGRIRQAMTNCEHFGPESFYLAIEIEGELIFAFEVRESDCIG